MINKNTCCFTGHRSFSQSQLEKIILNLYDAVNDLTKQGVTTFISGGALGFDQLAASLILSKKETGDDIRLLFALPCHDQDKLWSPKQQLFYHDLLSRADGTYYVSEEYDDGCMKKRNEYMVKQSSHCICALLHPHSGTYQTVCMAKRHGLQIRNVAVAEMKNSLL